MKMTVGFGDSATFVSVRGLLRSRISASLGSDLIPREPDCSTTGFFIRLRCQSKFLAAACFVILNLGFTSFLHAGIHNIPPVNEGQDGGFTVTATVTGATRVAFKEDFDEEGFSLGAHPLAIYTASGSVQLRIDATYHGTTRVEEVKLNGQDSLTDTRTIPLHADIQGINYAFGVQLVEISGWYVLDRKNEGTGETWEEYIPFRVQFLHEIRIYKDLWIEMRMPGAGFDWVVESRRIAPSIHSDPEGFDRVNIGWSAWPDVGVEISGTDKLLVEPSGWFRTDEHGNARVRVAAPLDAFSDEGIGLDWYSEEVNIRAVKGSSKVETTDRVQVPFCVVTLSNRAWRRGNVDGLGGEEPLLLGPPMILQKGDRVQIGTSSLSGFLRIRFANGYRTELEASGMDGFVAIIGDGDVTRGRSLISLSIQNTSYDIQTDPRRFGRMVTYKGAGMALDYALGSPDVVGIVSDTPGSLVEKALIKWVEPNYKYTAPRTPQPISFSNSLIGGEEIEFSESEGELLGNVQDTVYLAVELFSDGTLRVDNHGAPLELLTTEGAQQQVPTGSATWLMRTPQQTLIPSTSTTPPSSWNLNISGSWIHSPGINETVLTETLPLTIGHENAASFRWESATVRLDDVDITSHLETAGTFGSPDYRLAGNYTQVAHLQPGAHHLRFDVEDLSGEKHTVEVPFTFSPPAPASAAPAAAVMAEGVWLSWTPTYAGAVGARLWRRVLPDGAPSELVPLVRHGGFWDENPEAEAEYWIEWLDASDNVLATSPNRSVTWNNSLPSAPPAPAAALPDVEPRPEGLRLRLPAEILPGNQRWQLLAADSEAGPYEDIFPDEDQVPDEWIDTTVTPGATRHYKLFARSLDGIPQTTEPASVAGTNPLVPLTPQGFSLHRSTQGIELAWNPVDDTRAQALRVYQVVDQQPVLHSEHALSINRHVLTNTVSGIFFITTVSQTGVESPPSHLRVSFWHDQATDPAIIAMTQSEITVREGDEYCTLTVQRSGNLDEAVFIPWTLRTDNYPYVTFGEDLAFRSEFLSFASGQSMASITLPIYSDDQDEGFEFVNVVFGTPQGAVILDPDQAMTTIRIEESDLILFADYQTEGRVSEQDGAATLTIERLWPSNRNISVQLALADPPGDAQPDTDFQDTRPWIFTFAPGETRASLQIPVLDNTVKDGHRSLLLTLASPAGGSSLAAGFDSYELIIRDNETLSGQFQPAAGQTFFLADADTIEIPLDRIGGVDGTLDGMAMPKGGSLSWGSVSCTPPAAQAGETTSSISVTLDREAFESEATGLAPYAVITIINDEEPYENYDVLVIFPPSPSAGDYADWWQERTGSVPTPEQANPHNDSNQNRLEDFAEIALGGNPTAPSPAPSIKPNIDYGALGISVPIHPHPRLVILGEFSANLTDGFPILHGGYWYQDAGAETAEATFSNMMEGKSQFARLAFYWIED